MARNQRLLSKHQKSESRVPEDIKLERNQAKDLFDIQMMSSIKLISDASEKGILVVFLTSASGNFNCDARRLTALQTRIPQQIMDPNMAFFKPIQDHFKLLDCGLSHPRYMDFLKPGTPYLFGTFKPHNGNSGTLLRKERAPPNDLAPTSTKKNLYIQKSQDVDIISNTINIMCYRNDEKMPVVDYAMVMEGNPKVTSKYSILRNMVPSPPDRLFVNYDGDTKIDDNQQRFKMYQPGAHADHWPFREDNTLIIEQIISHLQLDDVQAVPFQNVRYPREEGQFKAEQLQARAKWFQDHLDLSKADADDLALAEMEQIFQLEPGRISDHDPMKSINFIADKAGDDYQSAADAYWRYFDQLDEKLITTFPMQTYQKTRYYVGQNLDLYPNGKLPPPKSLFTTNAKRFANVAMQLSATGCFSEEEERRIYLEQTQDMIRPAEKFGAMEIKSDQPDQFNPARQQKLPGRERKAYNDETMSQILAEADLSMLTKVSERPVSQRSSTVFEGSDISFFEQTGPRPSTTKMVQDRVDEILDQETTLEPVPKNTLKSVIEARVAAKKKAKTETQKPEVEVEEITEEVQKISLRSRLRKKKVHTDEDTELPDSPSASTVGSDATILNQAMMSSEDEFNDSFPTLIRPRPKSSTIGAFFEQIGTCIAPLYGSTIFPAAPASEKLHWEAATGVMQADLEKYDGQLQPQYIEEVRSHMDPILKAMDYKVSDPMALDRHHPDVSEHLRQRLFIIDQYYTPTNNNNYSRYYNIP